jgi:hypothetical protein
MSTYSVERPENTVLLLGIVSIHNIITYVAAPSSSVHRKKSPLRTLSRLLPLSSVLGALASRVTRILDSTGQSLQSVADGFGAGGAVDRVSHPAACGSNNSASGLCDAADCVAELWCFC